MRKQITQGHVQHPFLQPAAQSRLERDRHRSRRGSKQRNAFFFNPRRNGAWSGIGIDRAAARSNAMHWSGRLVQLWGYLSSRAAGPAAWCFMERPFGSVSGVI
jgi:hypothetical protein